MGAELPGGAFAQLGPSYEEFINWAARPPVPSLPEAFGEQVPVKVPQQPASQPVPPPPLNLGEVVVTGEKPPVPGVAFRDPKTGKMLAGNVPGIAERAAAMGMSPLPTRGAFSPGRALPSFSKSFEEVANTESPAIQDLWLEMRAKDIASRRAQAATGLEEAQTRIAEEQAREAALPWEEQIRRQAQRDLARRAEIIRTEAPSIQVLVDDQVQQLKDAYRRANGKPMPPEEEQRVRRIKEIEIQDLVVNRILGQITPQALAALMRNVIPGAAGLLGGATGGTTTQE